MCLGEEYIYGVETSRMALQSIQPHFTPPVELLYLSTLNHFFYFYHTEISNSFHYLLFYRTMKRYDKPIVYTIVILQNFSRKTREWMNCTFVLATQQKRKAFLYKMEGIKGIQMAIQVVKVLCAYSLEYTASGGKFRLRK